MSIEVPDLLKTEERYAAHEDAIEDVRSDVRMEQDLIHHVLNKAKERNAKAGRKNNLPPLRAIDQATHINCVGLQVIFHTMAMEAFRREHDHGRPADIRELLRKIASIRVSVLQYPELKEAMNFMPEIEAIDQEIARRAPQAVEIPSLTPYLFNSQTAHSQLKNLLATNKFASPDLLQNVGVLFPKEDYLLHSVCMSLVNAGSFDDVGALLQDRAIRSFPAFAGQPKLALNPLFQQSEDLFTVYIISLVEGGRTADAIAWCEKQLFKGFLQKSDKLAEKYATALRHQGFFGKAADFLRSFISQRTSANSNLRIQLLMAEMQDASLVAKQFHQLNTQKFQEREQGRR